jgi:hypothetical protein
VRVVRAVRRNLAQSEPASARRIPREDKRPERKLAMEDDEIQIVSKITASMVQEPEADFGKEEIENLGILIRLSVQFHNFLTSRGRWPVFPEDSFHNMTYVAESIFWNVNSFIYLSRNSYGIMTGRTRSVIDWDAVTAHSIKDRYLSMYQEFIGEADFLKKYRVLLDLYKLQLVYAGMFYDCD